MYFLKSKKVVAGLTAVVAGLGIALAGGSAAMAADDAGHWTPEGTQEPWFIYDLGTSQQITPGTTLHFDSDLFAAPSATNIDQPFDKAPSDATGVKYFIAPRGQESNIAQWSSSETGGFMTDQDKRVLQPTSSLYQFPASFSAVKAAGGNYSLGIAYTKNNGVTLVGSPSYTWVTITAGSGDWTFTTPEWVADQVSGPKTGDITVEAPVAAPVDGALSLTVPSGAKATLGAAALDSTGKSVSNGTLPTFQVKDERYSTKPGWTVNTSVAAFVSGANTFDAAALAITPAINNTSTATGVTKVTSLTGSTAAGKFAEAATGAGTGTTDLSAALTLTAPLGTPAGTYTSTMTVTVVSK